MNGMLFNFITECSLLKPSIMNYLNILSVLIVTNSEKKDILSSFKKMDSLSKICSEKKDLLPDLVA